MSPDLDKQLCEKYPKIFADRYKSPQESCIAFGIECGDGWYDVIDSLCCALSRIWTTSIEIDKEDATKLAIKKSSVGSYFLEIPVPQVIATQVKEKFGALRFYYNLEVDPNIKDLVKSNKYPALNTIMDRYYSYFDGIIHMAESISARTCELSGRKGELHVSGGNRDGWYKTLNVELAKTRQDLVDREYIPVSMLPEE